MITHSKTIRSDEWIRFDIAPVTADVPPKPAQLDSDPVVTSGNTSVATVRRYNSDSAYGWVIEAVAPGTAVVTVAASSAGVDKTEVVNVTVVIVPADNLGIAFGDPAKK